MGDAWGGDDVSVASDNAKPLIDPRHPSSTISKRIRQ
jgi:hypothetical protein